MSLICLFVVSRAQHCSEYSLKKLLSFLSLAVHSYFVHIIQKATYIYISVLKSFYKQTMDKDILIHLHKFLN